MVAVQVHGNNAAIQFAGSQGNFELNVFKPVIIQNFLQAARLLSDVSHGFVTYCITGITLDRARIAADVERSLMLVTALSPVIGYDKAAQLAHLAHVDGSTLREANTKLGFVSDDVFLALMRPETMIGL